MQAVAQVCESTQVLMLSKKQWFEPRRMGSLWFGGVLVFLSVSSLLLLSVAKEAHLGQRTRPVAGLWRFNFIHGPKQNWNTKATGSRSSTQRFSYALPASVLARQGSIV
jgi:hypothetical protein